MHFVGTVRQAQGAVVRPGLGEEEVVGEAAGAVGLDGAVIDIIALTPSILDGYTGKLILFPSPETLERYRNLSLAKERVRSSLDAMSGAATETTDG